MLFLILFKIIKSDETPPITINPPASTTTDYGEHVYYNENDAAQAIIGAMGTDSNSAYSFINKLKYSNKAKTLFNKFEMSADQTDQTWRNGFLKTGLISGRKEGNKFTLRGILLNSNVAVNAYYVEVHKKKKKFLGIKVGSKTKRNNVWRPLNSAELNQVYSTLSNNIQGTVQQLASSI